MPRLGQRFDPEITGLAVMLSAGLSSLRKAFYFSPTVRNPQQSTAKVIGKRKAQLLRKNLRW